MNPIKHFFYASTIHLDYFNHSSHLLLHNEKKTVNDSQILEVAKTICRHSYLKGLICPPICIGKFFYAKFQTTKFFEAVIRSYEALTLFPGKTQNLHAHTGTAHINEYIFPILIEGHYQGNVQ